MSNNTTKILISSCLLGNAVRYDATDLKQDDKQLAKWFKEDRLVAFCPEVAAGMSIPRAPAEIIGGSGEAVLLNDARVIDNTDKDVTDFFIKGAQQALEICINQNIQIAILTERSPSCGGQQIYNGQFNQTRIPGEGVTTALLRLNHIKVYNQHQINEVQHYVYKHT